MDCTDKISIVLAALQGATLIAIIVYVCATFRIATTSSRSVEEMKASREQEHAPYVVVFFDLPYGEDWITLVFENTGASVAQDIQFYFTPELQTSSEMTVRMQRDFKEIPLIKRGFITSLTPGSEIRTAFDKTSWLFGEEVPRDYTVHLSYVNGMTGKRFSREEQIGVSHYESLRTVT